MWGGNAFLVARNCLIQANSRIARGWITRNATLCMCVLDDASDYFESDCASAVMTKTACYHLRCPHNVEGESRILWGRGVTGSTKHVTSGYIRIETANTNVPLMHRAVWIRNRRQASRRVGEMKHPRRNLHRLDSRWLCMRAFASTPRFIANVCTSRGMYVAGPAFSRGNASRSLFPRDARGLLSRLFRRSPRNI